MATGKRLKNLSFESGTETTDENGVVTVTLTGNYKGLPFVSAQANGSDYNAFVSSVQETGSGWQVIFGTSIDSSGFQYQVWGEINENF